MEENKGYGLKDRRKKLPAKMTIPQLIVEVEDIQEFQTDCQAEVRLRLNSIETSLTEIKAWLEPIKEERLDKKAVGEFALATYKIVLGFITFVALVATTIWTVRKLF